MKISILDCGIGNLKAIKRKSTSSGSNNKLRSNGLIPAILYGGKDINQKAIKNHDGWGAMQYPQLVLGMMAIFTYVGVEVTIQSNLGELLKNVSDVANNLNPLGLEVMSDSQIAKYISLYWGGLMIGRWTGSITVFNPPENMDGTYSKLERVVECLYEGVYIIGCNKLLKWQMAPNGNGR